MSSIKTNPIQNTPFQQVKNSTPVEFAQKNRVITGAAITGAGIIGAYAADSHPIAGNIMKKGVVPVLGAGAAALGGLMVHDAIVNGEANIENSDNKEMAKLKNIGQLGGGAALSLLGVEVAGKALGVKALQPINGVVNFVKAKPNAAGGLAYVAGGAYGTYKAIDSMQKEGLTTSNSLTLAGSVGGSSLGLHVAGRELFGASAPKVAGAMTKLGSAAAGSALGLAAVSLGKETYAAMKEGDELKTLLAGAGTLAAGTASVHLLGNATGVQSLSNLGYKMFASKPLLTGAIAATAIGVGAYMMHADSKAAEEAAK